jgi:DNA-binding NarL/FixJ family response regulator
MTQVLTDHHQPGIELTHSVRLTHREQDVLALLCLRRTNAEMATQLCVSIRTIEAHVARILQKLAVSNRRDAAAMVRQTRIAPSLSTVMLSDVAPAARAHDRVEGIR